MSLSIAEDFKDLGNGKYVIKSEKIMIFPCAHRGEVDFGRYSQLMTEYNLTHLQGTAGTFDSYIIKDDNSGFACMLGGYLICLTDSLPSNYTQLKIRTNTDTTGSGVGQDFAKVLVDPDAPNIVKGLDIKETDSSTMYFYGLHFLTQTNATSYTYSLTRQTDISAIARYDSTKQQLYLN